jgi:hypothetical protein
MMWTYSIEIGENKDNCSSPSTALRAGFRLDALAQDDNPLFVAHDESLVILRSF